MYLFRIHIRPGGGDADMETTFAYCLKHGFLGAGWRVDLDHNTTVWEEYHAKAIQTHGSVPVCQYIQRWVSEGSLVWTRDTGGQYYLARVTSGWEYWYCAEAVEQDIDIANVFRCEIRRVHIDAVPGKVVACFRARRTIQEVASESAFTYSKFLWNALAGSAVYEIEAESCQDIFMLLDDQETEDLLFLYLQSLGWYVVPNSRAKDTMAFEYLLVRPGSGELAAAQVKTGGVVLDRDEYAGFPHTVFLFQSSGFYAGTGGANVVCVSVETMRSFLEASRHWLPRVFRNKLAMTEAEASSILPRLAHAGSNVA